MSECVRGEQIAEFVVYLRLRYGQPREQCKTHQDGNRANAPHGEPFVSCGLGEPLQSLYRKPTVSYSSPGGSVIRGTPGMVVVF
jgi:hypothetical protein